MICYYYYKVGLSYSQRESEKINVTTDSSVEKYCKISEITGDFIFILVKSANRHFCIII